MAKYLLFLSTFLCTALFSSPTSHLPETVRDKIRPYLIPFNHPLKGNLDAIFTSARATLNEKSFAKAGFQPLGEVRSKTYLWVARHPLLPGYLIKAYLDNELRVKQKQTGWKWLVQRCEGARKIRKIIQKKHFKYFTVPDKWIYPLPAKPSPPHSTKYKNHYIVLLVTDMNLASEKENYYAWKNLITKEHLDELYYIIKHANGSAYRPDNIALTKNGTFAFIDTEYPDHSPDFHRIRLYLNQEMLDYWDTITGCNQ